MRDEKVRYAGYRKPHPLENKIEVRVSTNGEISPFDSFKDAINSLIKDFDYGIKKFRDSVQNFKSTKIMFK